MDVVPVSDDRLRAAGIVGDRIVARGASDMRHRHAVPALARHPSGDLRAIAAQQGTGHEHVTIQAAIAVLKRQAMCAIDDLSVESGP